MSLIQETTIVVHRLYGAVLHIEWEKELDPEAEAVLRVDYITSCSDNTYYLWTILLI